MAPDRAIVRYGRPTRHARRNDGHESKLGQPGCRNSGLSRRARVQAFPPRMLPARRLQQDQDRSGAV
ncbi:hypothetical protein Naga_100466g1 [Nannochloropsis gaditana]|uniref:Uncharacterized protein n=1 Tax=Nannochloropsis gaditana TaxID=72520 RepID=W7T2W2_9STRA|nr:hypothetical protein Naga_100466g1 [Nannochloropsis gaditana]